MPKKILADGVMHVFPDKATDAEISSALAALSQTTQLQKNDEMIASRRAAEPQGSGLRRFGRELWGGTVGAIPKTLETIGAIPTSVLPGELGRGSRQILKERLLDPTLEQGRRAMEAGKSGRYSEMVGHGVAAALPLVGPAAADVGETAGQGDIAGAAGKVGAGIALAKGVPAIAKNPTVQAGAKGALEGATESLRGSTQIPLKLRVPKATGVEIGQFEVPRVVGNTAAGMSAGMSTGYLMGAPQLGAGIGAGLGLVGPPIVGAVKGAATAIAKQRAKPPVSAPTYPGPKSSPYTPGDYLKQRKPTPAEIEFDAARANGEVELPGRNTPPPISAENTVSRRLPMPLPPETTTPAYSSGVPEILGKPKAPVRSGPRVKSPEELAAEAEFAAAPRVREPNIEPPPAPPVVTPVSTPAPAGKLPLGPKPPAAPAAEPNAITSPKLSGNDLKGAQITQLRRDIHAIGAAKGLDHAAVSDVAAMRFKDAGAKGFGDLTPRQYMEMFEDLAEQPWTPEWSNTFARDKGGLKTKAELSNAMKDMWANIKSTKAGAK